MKDRKPAETVTLTEDVRVPGTDIILEKGDTIEIFPKREERKEGRKRSKSVMREEWRKRLREKQAEARKARKEKEDKEEE